MEAAVATDKLIDIISTSKPRPRPVDSNTITEPAKIAPKLLSDKEKITELLASLEEVRLNMKDSGGQGFLFNASASIRLFLEHSK